MSVIQLNDKNVEATVFQTPITPNSVLCSNSCRISRFFANFHSSQEVLRDSPQEDRPFE